MQSVKNVKSTKEGILAVQAPKNERKKDDHQCPKFQ